MMDAESDSLASTNALRWWFSFSSTSSVYSSIREMVRERGREEGREGEEGDRVGRRYTCTYTLRIYTCAIYHYYD